ncbi:MAG TPA: tRNA 2-selenouridine(34) synthase MnmH, partial [Burkholderiaceae bacterium]
MSEDQSRAPSIAPPVPAVPVVGLEHRASFDTLIDARTPAEYALDHLPGAINCWVLDDEERHVVGTLYVQQGAFEARRVGGAMVAANLARHLQERFSDQPADWRPLVYCWRGGMRSGAMTHWMRAVGWDAAQLSGGYRQWRRHVVGALDALAPRLHLVVLAGPTGSAKTRVLQALAAQGEQVLDLEGLACHKGSLLGDLPGVPQPTQKAFETRIVDSLERFDLARTIFVEGESRKIGRLAVPLGLVQRMRAAPVAEVVAPFQARVDYLLRDYAYLAERPDWFAEQLAPLVPLHGRETIASWQALARAREAGPLLAAVVGSHYDPAYARSQGVH